MSMSTLILAGFAFGQIDLGPEELVQAGGADIGVPGYSVPSHVDWNNDGLMDLIVGEGSGTYPQAKVRIYLNTGTSSAPQFSSYTYAQSDGSDLSTPGSGCLGLFPRVVYWDADARKDLLIGQADGAIRLFLNNGTDDSPTFDGGTLIEVGPTGSKMTIDVGARATPSTVDWNNDGRKDLIAGALDGRIHILINEGSDAAPDFLAVTFAQEGGSDLVVPSGRSSPVILDIDGDGKKDLLAGNTNGQLFFYSNAGTDATPAFSGYTAVRADGTDIDLPGTPRSRQFACDWTGDGALDVLIGASDGNVHLYQGVPDVPGDFDFDGNVDGTDLVQFGLCFTGPDGGPIDTGCEPGDFEPDGDIDCDDWDQFLVAWTEPGDPPDPPAQVSCDIVTFIPVASNWGLVAMAVFLLVCGVFVVRRRAAK
jgi:hypothetical protein